MDELEEAFNAPTREPTRQVTQPAERREHADLAALNNLIRQINDPRAIVFRFFRKCVPYWLATAEQSSMALEDAPIEHATPIRNWHLTRHTAQSHGLLCVFVRLHFGPYGSPIGAGQYEQNRIDQINRFFWQRYGRRALFWNPSWVAKGAAIARGDGTFCVPIELPKVKRQVQIVTPTPEPTAMQQVPCSPAWREASAAVAEARSALQLLRRTIYGRPVLPVRLSKAEPSAPWKPR
jgi:hypothetical protein